MQADSRQKTAGQGHIRQEGLRDSTSNSSKHLRSQLQPSLCETAVAGPVCTTPPRLCSTAAPLVCGGYELTVDEYKGWTRCERCVGICTKESLHTKYSTQTKYRLVAHNRWSFYTTTAIKQERKSANMKSEKQEHLIKQLENTNEGEKEYA